MSLDIDSYVFQGDELLDRLDNLNAAIKTAEYRLKVYQERLRVNGYSVPSEFFFDSPEVEHALGEVDRAHQDMDELFRKEVNSFYIECRFQDENGDTEKTSIEPMHTDANSYSEMVEALAEINGNFAGGEPRIDNSSVPSVITAVDYSDELIETWERLEAVQDLRDELEI